MDTRYNFRIPEFTDKGTFTGFQYIEVGDFIETTLCGSTGTPEQCTGIPTKDGKYIYENDIVKLPKGEVIWIVRYSRVRLGFILVEYGEVSSFRTLCGVENEGEDSSYLGNYIIIGNTHEGAKRW